MKNYTTINENGTLVFKIDEGEFKDVKYIYNSLSLNGELKYRIKSKKTVINEDNKLLFEQEIRNILKDKLSKI